MSYDEELEYLRKEFKKSEAKFHEAEREGWHTDSNIYKDNMENLGYQIHIHAQAAKADEYEAKAKAWDKLYEYVSTTPYDGIDIDTLKNRLDRFLNESGE